MKVYKTVGILAGLAMPMFLAFGQQTPEAEATRPPATAQAAVEPQNLSSNVSEVVRLAESGVAEDVLLAYVHNSQLPFALSSQDILYLKDVGLTPSVVTAMLNRDNELRGQAPAQTPPTYEQRLYANGAQPQVAPQAAPQVAPAPSPEVVQAPAPPPQTEPPTGAVVASPTTPAPVYVANAPSDVSYFYNDLAPYGTWIELQGVGWCWQPRAVVINRGWRPYCDSGYWMNSDAGWYWHSDYSWGWAPFHYGRWHLHSGCGWVWLPDRVWGPAWVTWRSGGDHCGWAPLPPYATFDAHLGYGFHGVQVGVSFDFGLHADAFTFIAVSDFHRHDYGHYRVAPTQVNNIYNHTTVINNYVVNNNVVVNRGLPVERVSAATHTQFQKAVIRDAPAGRAGELVAQNQSRGVVYRTQLATPARPERMVAQKVDPGHPVVQHASLVTPANRPPRLGSPGSSVSTPTPVRPTTPDTIKRMVPQTTTGNAPQNRTTPATPAVNAATPPVRPTTPTTVNRPVPETKVNAGENRTVPAATSTAPTTPARTSQEAKNYPTTTPSTVPDPRSTPPSSYSNVAREQTAAPSSQAKPNSHFYQPKTYYQNPKARTPVNRQPSAPSSTDSRDRSSSEPRRNQ